MTVGSTDHRIIFLVRSLEVGGAERQLTLVAKELQHRGLQLKILTFYDGGAFRTELEDASVPVIALSKSGRWDVIRFLVRLVVTLRRERPTVLHSYLTIPNVLAVILKPFLPPTRLIWGLRGSAMELERYDWLARAAEHLEGFFARWPDLIISNSHAGRTHAIRRGYPAERIVVIPNGIDTERFQFDEAGRHRVRDEWGIAPNELLIGLAARLDPMKDQANFLEAVAKVRKALPSVRFACVGSGRPALTNALRSHAEQLGLADIGVWSGTRSDMPAVYSAFDVAVSSAAFGEGFSNAVAEAMACQCLCVVTDVGDSGLIVGDTGAIVPSRDPQAMCSALLNLASSLNGRSLRSGMQARARVNELFNVCQLVERTTAVLGKSNV